MNEYLELNCVAENATGKGNNSQIIMENLHDGTAKITEGRVGIRVGRNRPHSYIIQLSSWDNFVQNKINHGYIITKTKKMEKRELVKGGYKPITDLNVREIVERLTHYANEVIEQNYTTKIDDISDEMVDMASGILMDLSKRKDVISVAEFNNRLKVLFAVIPRRIDNLSKVLANRKTEINDILADEQELFDLIVSQLKDNKLDFSNQKTILEIKDISWRPVTDEEKMHIIDMMKADGRRYIQAWRIENNKTRNNLNSFIEKENLHDKNDIVELFHGSRSENFWSIVTNGLTINPSGVVITGKMFGNGTCAKRSAITF